MIKYYLRLYKEFVITSTSVAMSFRTSFFLLILMDLIFMISTLLTVEYIYLHVSHIGGWQKSQLLFFTAFMLCIDQLHMAIFSTNFWVMSDDIKTGQMDYIILKPAHTLFSTFFRYFRPSAVITSLSSISALIYYGSQLGFNWHQWAFIPLLLLVALSFLVVLEFILSASMFWVTEGAGINFLRMGFQRIARYPHFIYSSFARKILFIVIPVLFIGSAPIEFLLDYQNYQLLLAMLFVLIGLILFLNYIWKKALNQYESASS